MVTPRDRAIRSGLTVFRAGDTRQHDLAIRESLLARDVEVSVRYTSGIGGVRVATHVYNNEGDMDRFLEAVRSWLRTR